MDLGEALQITVGNALESLTLKRLAWRYACAKKGSAEEDELRKELVARVIGDYVLTSGASEPPG